MEVEQLPQLIVSRRILSQLVKQFDFNRRVLNEVKLKELKQILKSNPDIIEPIFTDFLKYFRQNDCEYRLAVLQLCNEFFQRSHIFRVQLTNHMQEVLLHTVETDPIHYPLPPPREAAKILKLESLKFVKLWHEKYAEAYPKLGFAVNFLRSSKCLDFERASVELQVERQRAEEANRKKDEQGKRIVEKVEGEFKERQEEILRCINETRHALELLVPRFDVSESTGRGSDLRCETEKIHGYNFVESVAVTVPLDAPIVNVNAENEIIINALMDCMKMLQFCKKVVHRWLFKLGKYGGSNAQKLCKEIVDLKNRITVELEKCEELHLQNRQKSDEEDSESDDLEDVPEKEGLELDHKLPEELPEYILKKTIEKVKNDLPGANAIAGTQKLLNSPLVHKKYQDHESKVPVLLYGLDLKYWGENDVKPAEIPRNNADCHRFWRPSDESCSTHFDIAEAYHARVMTFIGQQLKGSRQCRASLSDGTLCPRMDLKRCPLHGKIIDRDEMGYPMNEIIQKPQNSENDAKEEEKYIKDVEAATGVNLRGKVKRGRRKRQEDTNSNASAAVRKRLGAKLFNRNTIKRVYDTLESVRKARAAKNFEHQFNYACDGDRDIIVRLTSDDKISRLIKPYSISAYKLFSSATIMPLTDVPNAKIDPDGVFKYILIKVIEKVSRKEKLIVRGYSRCDYHGDVLEETEKELGSNYELVCLGGGRIKHESKNHNILVYGYSQGYGPADHQKSVDILREKYPDYKISFSTEGY
ncbi:UV-stimulated scaffold protein [Dirofilaria immitis]